MTKLSRRNFITGGTGSLAVIGCPTVSGSDKRLPVWGAYPAMASSTCNRELVCLIEHPRPDGSWEPSSKLLRMSELLPNLVRGSDERWYLSSGERVSFHRRDFTTKVERKKRVGPSASTTT